MSIALCVPRSPETFADCVKSYTKPWFVHTLLKNLKNSIKVALRACQTQLVFENVLRIFWIFITSYFSGECTVKVPRGNYLTKSYLSWCSRDKRCCGRRCHTVFWQRRWKSWRPHWHTHWQRWWRFCWYARQCWSPDYTGLILCCQTHVHAVENTNVEVIAGGNSEQCEKFDFFENWYWEKSWLWKSKNGFRTNLLLLVDFSVFRVCSLLSFTLKQWKTGKISKLHFRLRGGVASPDALEGLSRTGCLFDQLVTRQLRWLSLLSPWLKYI